MKIKTGRQTQKQIFILHGGPWDGKRILLTNSGCTHTITVKNETGQYCHGQWRPSCIQ